MKKILIITDYGKKIGAGHFMRCKILAEKLRFFVKVDIVTSKKVSENINNIKYIYSKNIIDKKNFINKIKIGEYSSVIIDTYKKKERLIESFKISKKKIYCFDDFGKNKIKTNIINQNPFFSKKDYSKSLSTNILVGQKYTCIQSNLKQRNMNFKKFNFLVSCGMYDQNNNIIKIVNFLDKLDQRMPITANIALNSNSKNYPKISKIIKSKKNFYLIKDQNEYAKSLKKCNIAITTLGVSTWERFFIGMPCMIFCKEKKEEIILKKILSNKCALEFHTKKIDKNLKYFKELKKLEILLFKISNKTKNLFTLNGASNLTKKII